MASVVLADDSVHRMVPAIQQIKNINIEKRREINERNEEKR